MNNFDNLMDLVEAFDGPAIDVDRAAFCSGWLRGSNADACTNKHLRAWQQWKSTAPSKSCWWQSGAGMDG